MSVNMSINIHDEEHEHWLCPDVLPCSRTCFCSWLKRSVGSAGSGPSCPACACSAGLSCVQGTPVAATPLGRASAGPMPLLVVSLPLRLDVALMLCFTETLRQT